MSDNGPQFNSREYKNFCQELKINNLYSTPRYPQSNGQAEASNKTLLTALKKQLDSTKGKCVDELPGVLWAYRTTAHQPTDISPFALTYGMEAIVPTEIDMPTLRTDLPEQSNTETVIKDLDTADELREAAVVRISSYHNRTSKPLQQVSETLYVSARGLGPKKSFQKYSLFISWKVPAKLGGTIYCNTDRRIRIVCIR